MKSCILALVLLAIGGSAPAQKPEPAREVPYCDLVKTPQEFSGKRIRVRAIYKYGFEIQRLDSRCPERGAKIWVEIDSGLKGDSLKLYHKFPKGMGLALATFEGNFESGGPYGDGGYRLKFTVNKIEELEHTAKASARHEPPWVPKNCEAPGTTQPKSSSTVIHESLHAEGAAQFVPSRGYAYDEPE